MKRFIIVLVLVFGFITLLSANSIERYKASCEMRYHASSCIKLAKIYAQMKNTSEALLYMDRACGLGSGDACMAMVYHYKFGKDVEQNFLLASQYIRLVCKQPQEYKIVQSTDNWRNELENCKGLGLLDRSNPSHNIGALNYYSKECDSGDSQICLKLAHLYLRGKSISGIKTIKNNKLAMRYLKKSCELDNSLGCAIYGDHFYDNQRKKGVQKNKIYPELINIYEKSCTLGSSHGCKKLGDLYMGFNVMKYLKLGYPIDNSKVVKYYKKGCNLSKYNDSSSSCRDLGDLYRVGSGVKVNFNNMIKFYKIACKIGDTNICTKVGDFYSWTNMYKVNIKDKTEEFIGDEIKEQLGDNEIVVISTEVDYNQAKTYYEISCNYKGMYSGCTGLGKLYRDGKGVVQNLTLAKKYFELGCKFDDRDEACENLKNLR